MCRDDSAFLCLSASGLVGGGAYDLPEAVGLRMGPAPTRYILAEFHFNNE